MELSFSELRAKEVVNTQDGRKLGRVSDILLCYPENRWVGLIVPNGKSFLGKRQELFLDMKSIVKIGEDVILVNVGLPKKQPNKNGCPPNLPYGSDRTCEKNERNFDEFE